MVSTVDPVSWLRKKLVGDWSSASVASSLDGPVLRDICERWPHLDPTEKTGILLAFLLMRNKQRKDARRELQKVVQLALADHHKEGEWVRVTAELVKGVVDDGRVRVDDVHDSEWDGICSAVKDKLEATVSQDSVYLPLHYRYIHPSACRIAIPSGPSPCIGLRLRPGMEPRAPPPPPTEKDIMELEQSRREAASQASGASPRMGHMRRRTPAALATTAGKVDQRMVAALKALDSAKQAKRTKVIDTSTVKRLTKEAEERMQQRKDAIAAAAEAKRAAKLRQKLEARQKREEERQAKRDAKIAARQQREAERAQRRVSKVMARQAAQSTTDATAPGQPAYTTYPPPQQQEAFNASAVQAGSSHLAPHLHAQSPFGGTSQGGAMSYAPSPFQTTSASHGQVPINPLQQRQQAQQQQQQQQTAQQEAQYHHQQLVQRTLQQQQQSLQQHQFPQQPHQHQQQPVQQQYHHQLPSHAGAPNPLASAANSTTFPFGGQAMNPFDQSQTHQGAIPSNPLAPTSQSGYAATIPPNWPCGQLTTEDRATVCRILNGDYSRGSTGVQEIVMHSNQLPDGVEVIVFHVDWTRREWKRLRRFQSRGT